MMVLLRLIWRSVLPAVLIAWVAFVAIDLVLVLLSDVDEIGIGAFDLTTMVTSKLLSLPRRAHDQFFAAATVGLLAGLGGLAASSQLIALQAAAASRWRIAMASLSVIGVLLLVVVALGQWAGPAGDRYATSMVNYAKSSGSAIARDGLWLKEQSAIWNARQLYTPPAGEVELWQVQRLQFDAEHRLRRVDRAARAVHRDDHWWLLEGQTLQLVDTRVEHTEFSELQLDSQLDPGQIAAQVIRPRQQSVTELYRTLQYAQANGLDARLFESALWYKLSYPVVVLSLCLAGLPFAFGSLRSGGMGKRVFLGMALAITFFFLHRAAINYVETKGLNLPLVYFLPPLLVAAWGVRRLDRVS
ncbi:MAG: LPS export ABC transporter permease LptG [Xanthomonadales bacterium]|nr:LPS export ABC transporter permease LptG [Xanthomonadales bacterium]